MQVESNVRCEVKQERKSELIGQSNFNNNDQFVRPLNSIEYDNDKSAIPSASALTSLLKETQKKPISAFADSDSMQSLYN